MAHCEDNNGAARFAGMNGGRVRYLDVGSGETTLVCVHGWACDHTVWEGMTPILRRKTRLLLIDLPGFGASDEPRDGAYSMDVFARAVRAVMDDAGVSRGVLVGHSMGVGVIRQFYRRFPQLTQALVIVDGWLKPLMPQAATDRVLEQLKQPDYQEAINEIVAQAPTRDEKLRERLRQLMLATPQSALVGAMEAGRDPEIWKEDPIDVPTLCLMSHNPFLLGDEYEPFVRRLVPDVDYRVLEGVSHFMLMEQPERIAAIVREFCSDRIFDAS
jgi:pimeloyl-ACP methyl ester carboxylesterase